MPIPWEKKWSSGWAGPQCRVPDNWDLGSALVNQVPSLGEALGVLGKKKVMEKTRESYNLKPVGKLYKLAT